MRPKQHFEACDRVNARGPAILAAACQHLGIQLLTYSSDLVFDGKQSRPYVESNRPAPLGVYGSTKAEGEARALSLCPSALVVRTSSFFGPWDEANFVTQTLRKIAAGFRVTAASDVVVTPTYVPDLVHASLDLLLDGEQGLWHLTNGTAVTWYDLAQRAAKLANLNAASVVACPMHSLGFAAQRPSYSALTSERGLLLPSLDDALARYRRECEVVRAELTA